MSLSFGPDPGPRERHLRRRQDNPLFPPARRAVSGAELDAARRADQQDSEGFRRELRELLQEAGEMAGVMDTDLVLGVKERVERLYEQCAGLGGDHSREKVGLLRLNDVVVGALRAAAGADPLAQQELQQEQAAREIHVQLLQYPLVADLLSDASPIDPADLVPTILSESPESVRVAMSLFEPEQQAELRRQAKALVDQLERSGQLEPSVRDNLDAMSSVLQ